MGLEGDHLAVTRGALPRRVDDGCRVVNAIVATLEDRAREQPDSMARRHFAEGGFGRPRHRLRMLRRGAERAQLAEEDHLHPGEAIHEQVEALAHGGENFRLGPDGGLDFRERQRGHCAWLWGGKEIGCEKSVIYSA